MRDAANIERLLTKYHISRPLEREDKRFILRNQSSSYNIILKKAGQYSLLRRILFFLAKNLRKIGIRISPSSPKVVIPLASVATALLLISFFPIKDIFFPGVRKDKGVIVYADGPVRIKSKKKTYKKVKIKAIVHSGDQVETGNDALLILQIASQAAVNIEAISEVEIKKLLIDDTIQFYLSKGLLLSKVNRLHGNSRYIITTPNCEVEVIGTEFSVRYNNGKSTIALGKGKLRVKNIKSGTVTHMDPGTTLLITASEKKRSINQKELLELEKIGIIPIHENIESKSIRFFEEKAKEYRLKLLEIDRKIKKPGRMKPEEYISPLERLRRQGKLIILFHMRDGNIIAGSIVTQDEKIIRLDTGASKITLKKNEIKRRKTLE
jgi:hypothetical protein